MTDLRAGRKAKASAAYASACVYLAAGMALLDESDWGSQYDLMFSLRLERAECELLIVASRKQAARLRIIAAHGIKNGLRGSLLL